MTRSREHFRSRAGGGVYDGLEGVYEGKRLRRKWRWGGNFGGCLGTDGGNRRGRMGADKLNPTKIEA
jgi:hypothetical protein